LDEKFHDLDNREINHLTSHDDDSTEHSQTWNRRSETRIAVEIKSFASGSDLSEFRTALGQYANYRQVLEDQDPTRKLFLAVPPDTFKTFFQLPFT
jgi:hypothetical protein